jgi:jasmonate ZIM domain-containing protein
MRTSAIASIGARQLRRVIAGDDEAPAPALAPTMTLFYNGAVATFDGVSQDTASHQSFHTLCSTPKPALARKFQ